MWVVGGGRQQAEHADSHGQKLLIFREENASLGGMRENWEALPLCELRSFLQWFLTILSSFLSSLIVH